VSVIFTSCEKTVDVGVCDIY